MNLEAVLPQMSHFYRMGGELLSSSQKCKQNSGNEEPFRGRVVSLMHFLLFYLKTMTITGTATFNQYKLPL